MEVFISFYVDIYLKIVDYYNLLCYNMANGGIL